VSLDAQPPAAGPQVGTDEWVARQAQRREYLPSWLGAGQRQFERIGWWPKLAIAGLAGAALPLIGLGGFQLQVGIDTLVLALLAVGLNVVVGWAGLLDLGYIAFFGFGAYGFALLSSSQLGIHLWAVASLPIVMAGADAWDGSETIRRSIEIREGRVQNPRILSFQGRAAAYPYALV